MSLLSKLFGPKPKRLCLEDIRVIKGKVRPINESAVAEAEAALGCSFPAGYREYITKFGERVQGGTFVRVYPPARIVRELPQFRQRWSEYWFWEKGRAISSKEQVLESIIIADTMNGDEIIFHPNRPDRLLVLPRGGDLIYEAGSNLLDTLEWLCNSGVLTKPFKARNFEPEK